MNAITPIREHSPVPVVAIIDGRPMADSRNVAAMFSKRHDNVVRDIRGLLKSEDTPAIHGYFVESSYVDPQNGRTYTCYLMDRSGFSILAMGFTGARALRWKVDYNGAFEAMERQLRSRAAGGAEINVRDQGQLAVIATQLLQLTQEMRERAEMAEATVAAQSKELAIAAHKVEVFEAFMATGKRENLRTVCRLLNARQTEFFDWMKRRGFIFMESGWLQPRADLRDDGYMVARKFECEDGKVREQTLVTPAGQTWLAHRWLAHKRKLARKAIEEAAKAEETLFD
ncbi:phage regulatory protein/antirepressor Ant [Methylobacterium sp. AMS5]|uniref:phage regulatory protein/antirepressor Ant n=1 Tax=Methylobacterium sp. AMS5 TaxID=925818 RepID=UPI00074F8AF4|nr:phage regulatory protein/antirepressor Ant [Methylobacterium sp. AMS5]AMB45056.1 hypothetical protein Y590_09120 [Methylobacterium sp. AMS5]